MRAVVCHELGPPEGLLVEDRPPPGCPPGSVRIRVRAAGLNYVDALFVGGGYQIKPPVPFVPGSELAGEVVELGEGVHDVPLGRRVVASVGLGAFAEEVVTAAGATVPIPDDLDDARAATVGQSYCTGEFALLERAGLRAGQWLLVLGAGGGVGLAAVDIGVATGARVIAVASTPDKRAAAEAMGAEATIDPAAASIKERARELSGGGVDVVYDPVGGDRSLEALRALGDDGQLVVIGFASGEIPALPANQVLLRNRRVTGVDWGAWALAHPVEGRDLLTRVLGRVATGVYHPVAPTTYPLDQAGTAMRELLERQVTGKVALVP